MGEILQTIDLARFFPAEKGWNIIKVEKNVVDIRPTVSRTRIRCIDRRFGATPDGYDPDMVPLSPAWLGAIDGVASFLKGDAEERMSSAVALVESVGFERADHGDYILGDRGCGFRRALLAGEFEELMPLTEIETRVLRKKFGVHHFELHESRNHARGFLLNDEPFTTGMPEDGLYYPVDIWLPHMVGINPQKALPVVEKCGELLLPEGSRNLFVVV